MVGRCAGDHGVHRSAWPESESASQSNLYDAQNEFAAAEQGLVAAPVEPTVSAAIDNVVQQDGYTDSNQFLGDLGQLATKYASETDPSFVATPEFLSEQVKLSEHALPAAAGLAGFATSPIATTIAGFGFKALVFYGALLNRSAAEAAVFDAGRLDREIQRLSDHRDQLEESKKHYQEIEALYQPQPDQHIDGTIVDPDQAVDDLANTQGINPDFVVAMQCDNYLARTGKFMGSGGVTFTCSRYPDGTYIPVFGPCRGIDIPDPDTGAIIFSSTAACTQAVNPTGTGTNANTLPNVAGRTDDPPGLAAPPIAPAADCASVLAAYRALLPPIDQAWKTRSQAVMAGYAAKARNASNQEMQSIFKPASDAWESTLKAAADGYRTYVNSGCPVGNVETVRHHQCTLPLLGNRQNISC